jgi:hypothetical protein
LTFIHRHTKTSQFHIGKKMITLEGGNFNFVHKIFFFVIFYNYQKCKRIQLTLNESKSILQIVVFTLIYLSKLDYSFHCS